MNHLHDFLLPAWRRWSGVRHQAAPHRRHGGSGPTGRGGTATAVVPACLIALILAGTLMAVDDAGPDLVPLPAIVELQAGTFRLDADLVITALDALRDTAELCAAQLRGPTGFPIPLGAGGSIAFEQDAALARLTDEGYTLDVTPARVLIRSAHRRGLFYGFQTFRQLLPAQAFATAPVAGDGRPWTARCLHIEDRPRFPWWAMMLDCARTFQDAASIRHYIDGLAMHKINILHWHLTDDEGWRIEIKALPELTRAGAWYGGDHPLEIAAHRNKWFPKGDTHGGFYTQDEIRGIVAYASARGVDILPEIDVPGHSRAVVVAYPAIRCQGQAGTPASGNVWCASKPANEAMMTSIFTEVAALFPFSYIHIGGDEVDTNQWRDCPSCAALARQHGLPDGGHLQPLVTRRLEALCAQLGRKLVGWQEIMGKGISTDTCIMSYGGVDPGYAAAAKGHAVVMAPGPFTYFDMAQGPGERGHAWAGVVSLSRCYSLDPLMNPALTTTQLGNIVGVEACLWSEFCLPHPAIQRRLGLSDADLLRKDSNHFPAPPGFTDHQTHPRLAALAEMGWTPQEQRCFPDFARRLGHGHLARLSSQGITYRVPTPSAQHAAGTVTILPPWSGAAVHYTTDGSTPTASSPRYSQPFPCADTGTLRMVTVAPDGHASLVVGGAERAPVAAWVPGTFAATPRRVVVALADAIDRPGNWSVELRHRCGSARLDVRAVRLLIDGIMAAEDAHACMLGATRPDGAGAHAYRLPLKAVAAGAAISLEIEASTVGGPDSAGDLRLVLSPWHEPEVTVSCAIPAHAGHVAAHAADWKRSSFFWSGRAVGKGEDITWTFAQPVPSAEVRIPTGKVGGSTQDRLDSGTLLVSYDGLVFETLATCADGAAKAVITRPFQALRLRADADMRTLLVVQDPQISLLGLTPACHVATTMPAHGDHAPGHAADWKRDTWFWSSRAPVVGDTCTWTFAAPVSCATIELRTGDPADAGRDPLVAGVLEASDDGVAWVIIGTLANGRVWCGTTRPFKALRLRVTGGQQSWVMIQDPVLR